jgi:hypothetical protein
VTTVQAVLAAATQRVLLVEGRADAAVYGRWLKKLAAPGTLYTSKVELVEVEGKRTVLAVLEWFRDHGGNPTRLYGLVDRDEWDPGTIAAQAHALPQLRINPRRHALESYFCDPGEIGPALLAQNAAHAPHFPALEAQILRHLPERVDHWALFTTTERAKERMAAAQYPGIFHAQYQVPPDADIQQRLQHWAAILDPNALFVEFDQLRTTARAQLPSDRCRGSVWAKDFYEQVVCGGPDGLQSIDNKSVGDWMIDLAEFAPAVPGDIAAILQPFLL